MFNLSLSFRSIEPYMSAHSPLVRVGLVDINPSFADHKII